MRFITENLEDMAARYGNDPRRLGEEMISRNITFQEFLEFMDAPTSVRDGWLKDFYKDTAMVVREYLKR